MAIETGESRSRRAILGATIAGLGALVAHGLGRPERALAVDPNDLALGSTANTASSPTALDATRGSYGLHVDHAGDHGFGIWGSASGDSSMGVLGAGPESGTGVRGEGGAVGVFGLATALARNGVEGGADVGSSAYGVYGHSTGGFGVVESGGTGVGVAALASTGIALRVVGRARFDRSHRSTIAATKSSIAVTVPGVTTNSWVVATLQKHVAGTYVTAAVPSANKVTIYLNKAVTAATVVGFFVIN